MTRLQLIILVAMVGLSVALTDKQILQQALNGMLKHNKPISSIAACADDATSSKIVGFIGEALDKAAKGSLIDMIQLTGDANRLIKQLPAETFDCISNNLASIDQAVVEKLAAYASLHHSTVQRWTADFHTSWTAQKYYEAGSKAAAYLRRFFLTDLQILQQVLNGLFNLNKLPNSTTILPCVDDISASNITKYMKDQLDRLAKGQPADVFYLLQNISDFSQTLDPAVGECLSQSQQWTNINDIYGLTGADPQVLEKKYYNYLTLHYLTFHKWSVDIDNDWSLGKYYVVGQEIGKEGHTIFAVTSTDG